MNFAVRCGVWEPKSAGSLVSLQDIGKYKSIQKSGAEKTMHCRDAATGCDMSGAPKGGFTLRSGFACTDNVRSSR